MDNKQITDCVGHAFLALKILAEKPLPIAESAFLLAKLPPANTLCQVRHQLAARLRARLDTAWIKRGDLYEVFAVLTALWKYDQSCVTGEHLASAVQRLIRSEVKVGGPYHSQGKVDLAANAQIAIFMQLVAKPLPHVISYLDDTVTKRHFDCAYLSPISILSLLAETRPTHNLAQYAADNWQRADWQSPAHQALALSILKRELQDTQLQTAILALCAQQRPDGFWVNTIFEEKSSECSRFITTAIVVNVLTQFSDSTTKGLLLDQQLKQRIVAQKTKDIFSFCDEPLRSTAARLIDKTCQADKNFEITLLAQQFSRSLISGRLLTYQQHIDLSVASLCGWLAYTIYDDFLDAAGNPLLLPIANIAMRASIDSFQRALPSQKFQRQVTNIFLHMDEANAWEVRHCRFAVNANKITVGEPPKYGQLTALAARSLPHALAPMAVLAQAGRLDTKTMQKVEVAFCHYLIARQLNDDLHDWQEDVKSGQITYVVTTILHDMHVQPGKYDFAKLLPKMQECFRRITMLSICGLALWHIKESRRCFKESRLLRTPNVSDDLLDVLESSVRHSLDTQKKTLALDEYKN